MFVSEKPAIKEVFLYLRKSTREEDERQVRSITDQRSECLVMAERFGLNVVEEFEEDRSARRPNNRPEFKRMLKELSYKSPERRRADGILAWHPDRLTRNALEAGQIIQMIDEDLIRDLFFPSYAFHNSISGIEHLTSEFARAKGYTDRLAHVVKRGVHSREKEGAMIYPVKFGYQKRRESENPAKCSLFPVPHPEHFDVIQRMFALAFEGASLDAIHSALRAEYAHLGDLPISVSTINRNLNDSFYCGHWTIKSGTKDERIIDLNRISLPDQTTFEPVLSLAEFNNLQKLRNAKSALSKLPRKRINPLPGLVHCSQCGGMMYPGYRKIKRTGGTMEEQLGYECQGTSDNGCRCAQKRVKADVIFDALREGLSERSLDLGRREYYCFLYAAERFLKKATVKDRQEAMRLTKALKKHEEEKRALIQQKAELVSAGAFDSVTKEFIDSRLNKVQEGLLALSRRRSGGVKSDKRKVLSFKKFLELSLNLHRYWDNSNPEEKGEISKKLVLNLQVENAGVRSVSWIPPFSEGPKNRNFLNGRAQSKVLEPWFWQVWSGLEESERVGDIMALHEQLTRREKPKHPILRH